MRSKPSLRGILIRIGPVALAAGLVFAAPPANAWYGGYYGGRHGGYYGSHYSGYRGAYRGGYYGRNYGYRGSAYGGYGYRRHRYGYGPAYGLLSVPRAVFGSIFGYPRGSAYDDGAKTRGSSATPAEPSSPGDTGKGASRPTPQTSSAAPRAGGSGGIDGGGWKRLADGQYAQALAIFAAAAAGQPRTGGPKVGYALSAAAAGDLRRGVWAMRRAFRVDPDSIHYLTIGDSLRPRIAQLIARYQGYSGRTPGDAEAAFMLASLHYLLGDAESARGQLDRSLAVGDRSSSTTNLARLIDKELTAAPRHDSGGQTSQSDKIGTKTPLAKTPPYP